MPLFSLLSKTANAERWRTCSIFPANDFKAASRVAKSIRDANTIGFVPYPSLFRIRLSSRREVSLMVNFLNATDNSALQAYRMEDLDGVMRRRQNLLTSFYIGMYHQPDIMKKRFGGTSDGSAVAIAKFDTTGGSEMNENMPTAQSEEMSDADQSSNVADIMEDASQTDDANSFDDGPITDSSASEDALNSILSSSEASQQPNGGDEMDLDFL